MNDKIHESAGVENAEDKSIVVESDDESIGVNSESTGVSKAKTLPLIWMKKEHLKIIVSYVKH